jgi:hypothetical protein
MHESGFDIVHPDVEALFPISKYMKLAARFIRHGADQELEACCEWVSKYPPYLGDFPLPEDKLRVARRPNPPSLKEQALETLKYPKDLWSESEVDTIRRALEALPND